MRRLLSVTAIALLSCAAARAEEVELTIDFAKMGLSGDLGPMVNIFLDDRGTEELARFTSQRVGEQIFVYVADKPLVAPMINQPMLLGYIELTGNMDMKTADSIAKYIDRVGKLTLSDEQRPQ